MTAVPARWVAMFVFMLVTSISFLDRQILPALAVTIQSEFHLSSGQFGDLLAAFSILYALGAPVAGVLIDRLGLNMGISAALALWSLAGIATGFAGSFGALLACRGWLGLTSSATIPANGKAVGLYLEPQERSLGSASGQLGISIGLITAPLLASVLAATYGWRWAFITAGLGGLLWIPLWLWVSLRIPHRPATAPQTGSATTLLRDRRLWWLMLANMFCMSTYNLWANWTTHLLVNVYGLTEEQANFGRAWIPPVFAALGGLLGGTLALRFAKKSRSNVDARLRASLLGAAALIVTAGVPYLPNSTLATAAISWSFFWTVAFSVNLYALPIDYFGPARAASGIGALTFAYGLMQTVANPMIGRVVDSHGFGPVCAVMSVLPLGAWIILKSTARPA